LALLPGRRVAHNCKRREGQNECPVRVVHGIAGERGLRTGIKITAMESLSGLHFSSIWVNYDNALIVQSSRLYAEDIDLWTTTTSRRSVCSLTI
jgi:hypothetical protein